MEHIFMELVFMGLVFTELLFRGLGQLMAALFHMVEFAAPATSSKQQIGRMHYAR
jgi:hypothetical protein